MKRDDRLYMVRKMIRLGAQAHAADLARRGFHEEAKIVAGEADDIAREAINLIDDYYNVTFRNRKNED